MQKIVIINSKGGSGKPRWPLIWPHVGAAAENQRRIWIPKVVCWLGQRPTDRPVITGLGVFAIVRCYPELLLTPHDCTALIIDSPAGLDRRGLEAATRGADAILMPVRP